MNDPTQDRTPSPDIRSSTTSMTIHDDEFNEFDVEIRYAHFDYNGDRYLLDYNYRITWPEGFVPVMRAAALAEDVRYHIKAREGDKIIMAECREDITNDLT